MKFEPISKVPGFKFGNAQNQEAFTGCTVILCDDGSIGGVDQRGGSPGTRETDLLRPLHMVEFVNAILLTGGSAFGLDAAAGVMQFLEEKGKGIDTGFARVPIVPGAVIFDLGFGSSKIRPDAAMGYEACKNASEQEPKQGNYGAGIGATVGKILGNGQAMKGGIGHAAVEIGGGVWIGALMVVNALGDIVDPHSRSIIAGARTIKKTIIKIGESDIFANTLSVMGSYIGQKSLSFSAKQNTVIGAVLTNAKLSKDETNKLAQAGQNGLVLSIQPSHTMFDGDTMFAVSSQKKSTNINSVAAFAPIVVAQAIVNAVTFAESLGGIPSASDLIHVEK